MGETDEFGSAEIALYRAALEHPGASLRELATDGDDLKPVQSAQRLARARNRVRDRLVDASLGRPHEFDHAVAVRRHR